MGQAPLPPTAGQIFAFIRAIPTGRNRSNGFLNVYESSGSSHFEPIRHKENGGRWRRTWPEHFSIFCKLATYRMEEVLSAQLKNPKPTSVALARGISRRIGHILFNVVVVHRVCYI